MTTEQSTVGRNTATVATGQQRDVSPIDSRIRKRIAERMVIQDMGYKTPCWISTRAAQPNGYTRMYAKGKARLTHRVSYEAWHGPIPNGLVIDHLCRVRTCCNPEHLEPVTNSQNLVRGDTKIAKQVAQTHCHKGHEFTPDNTYQRPDRVGRMCRRCRAETAQRGRDRRSHRT